MKARILIVALVVTVLFGMCLGVVAQEQPQIDSRVKPILEIDGLSFKDLNANGKLDPYEDWRLPIDERVSNLVSLMTLEEKAGLMFHPIYEVQGNGVVPDTADSLINELHIRFALANRGVYPEVHAGFINSIQEIAEGSRLGIPFVYSGDPRHGVAGFMGSPQFMSKWPSFIGMGATRDLELVEAYGRVVAEEYRAVGHSIALHPQIDVATEPRWSRVEGTFGEDFELVAQMGAAYVRGLQGSEIGPNSVIAMVKHFPGGATGEGGADSHGKEGKYQVYPGGRFEDHLLPFKAALEVGAESVMPYYGIATGYDTVAHAFSEVIIDDLLRGKMGFDGVICTDWGAVTGRAYGLEDIPVEERYVMAIEVGIDQFGGEGAAFGPFVAVTPDLIVDLVNSGRITESRIDESVSRLLNQIFRLGLFEKPYVNTSNAAAVVGSARNKALGFEAQLKSIVLLANKGSLPLQRTVLDEIGGEAIARMTRIYVAGIDAKTAGYYADVVDDPEEADVALLWVSTRGNSLGDQNEDTILAVAQSGVPTILAMNISNPVVVSDEILNAVEGLLVTFSITDEALLEVVFGRFNPSGKLPFQMPSTEESLLNQLEDVPFDLENPLFDYGFGLSY